MQKSSLWQLISNAILTIVSTSKGPCCPSIFRDTKCMCTTTCNLTYIANIFDQSGDIPTVVITTTFTGKHTI